MDRGTWWAAFKLKKSQTRLNDFTLYFVYIVYIMPDAGDAMPEKIGKFLALKRVSYCHYFTAG